MKQIIGIFLLLTTLTFSQVKDSVIVNDTTRLNFKMENLQKQYDKLTNVIKEATTQQNRVEGAFMLLMEDKKDSTKSKDSTSTNNRMANLRKQFDELTTVIQNATIKLHQIEGGYFVLADEKKDILTTKYGKSIKR